MKTIVPYTKEIKFAGKLAEVCSISLEHELEISDNEIEGFFIVSGEYKAHSVSINKEDFNYKLPFSLDVTDNIIKDSIDFEITDFTYEIIDEETLKVNIEFAVTADEEEIEEETEESELNRDNIVETVNDLFNIDEEKEESLDEDIEETLEIREETENILDDNDEEETTIEEQLDEEEERLDQESADLILDSASETGDEFTTYYIHLVSSGDTIESIVESYQTDLETLKKYNKIDSLNVGDKIIIPSLDE